MNIYIRSYILWLPRSAWPPWSTDRAININQMNLHIWSNIMMFSIEGNMKFLSHRPYIRIMKYHIILVYYSVCSLTQLEELNLSWNRKLITLPDRVGDLKSLRKLNVSGCSITQLPDRLVKANRQLISLPVGWITSDNPIHTTVKITNKSGSSSPTLDASYCNITQLPDRRVNHHSWPFITSLPIFVHLSLMVHDTHHYNLSNFHVFWT